MRQIDVEPRTIRYGGVDITGVKPEETIFGTKDVIQKGEAADGNTREMRPGFTLRTGTDIPEFMRNIYPDITSVGMDEKGNITGFAVAAPKNYR